MTFFLNLDRDTTDRFDMAKFMAYTDNYDPLTSDFMKELILLPSAGEYTVKGEDSRPDLISYRIYNDTQYWWVILQYNKILDYSSIVTGDVLKYPDLSALEELYFSLKAKESKT